MKKPVLLLEDVELLAEIGAHRDAPQHHPGGNAEHKDERHIDRRGVLQPDWPLDARAGEGLRGPQEGAGQAKPMIQGVTNWTMLTPKLPTPAWIASAVPCSRLGKNRLVDGMKDEKLPPPSPASKASTIRTQ